MEVKLDVEEDEHEERDRVLSSIRNQKIKLLKDVVERDDNVNLSGLKDHFIFVERLETYYNHLYKYLLELGIGYQGLTYKEATKKSED